MVSYSYGERRNGRDSLLAGTEPERERKAAVMVLNFVLGVARRLRIGIANWIGQWMALALAFWFFPVFLDREKRKGIY